MPAYPKAIRHEFGRFKNPKTKHIKLESIRAHVNNNKIERYHNTFRERDKVARSWKSKKTVAEMSANYKTYYNFVRKHQGLNGLTPSQMTGLDLKLGQNRWLGLIRQSGV